MRKLSFFGILALAVILASTLTVTEGLAKSNAGTNHSTGHVQDSASLLAVSDPLSANCLGLGLVANNGGFFVKNYGSATITGHSVDVHVENALPNTVYTVSIGYLKAYGCNGTWKPVGSLSTDQAGTGQVSKQTKLGSNEYIVEVADSNGNVVYATPFMSM